MSITSTIARNGKLISWQKMSNGSYSTATGVVTPVAVQTKKIYAVIDGFGTAVSQLRANTFEKKTLVEAGQLRLLTVFGILPGDIIVIDSETYTVVYVKSIWKKIKIVCYEAVVQQ